MFAALHDQASELLFSRREALASIAAFAAQPACRPCPVDDASTAKSRHLLALWLLFTTRSDYLPIDTSTTPPSPGTATYADKLKLDLPSLPSGRSDAITALLNSVSQPSKQIKLTVGAAGHQTKVSIPYGVAIAAARELFQLFAHGLLSGMDQAQSPYEPGECCPPKISDVFALASSGTPQTPDITCRYPLEFNEMQAHPETHVPR